MNGQDQSELFEHEHSVQSLEAELPRSRATQDATDRLAAIVESSEDAIASKDLNGITSWNAAERMFGYRAEEIIGKPVTTIIPPELHKDEDMILGKIRLGERIQHFETVRVTKDGKRIDVSLTVSPVKDTNGHIVGAAKSCVTLLSKSALKSPAARGKARRHRSTGSEHRSRNQQSAASIDESPADHFLQNFDR